MTKGFHRFEFIQEGGEAFIKDWRNGNVYEIYQVADAVEITDLLNKLYDENKVLQKTITLRDERCRDLYNENLGLKYKIKEYWKDKK